MSSNPKRSNEEKNKIPMDGGPTSSGVGSNRVSSPTALLQEMSRSGYVPGFPAPGSFPGFPGRSWQDMPPFLLSRFMPSVPLSMDILSTALLHSFQGPSMYPSPTSLPMMRNSIGLIQPPFNAPPLFGAASNDPMQNSPVTKSQKSQELTKSPGVGTSKQRPSKRIPSETNLYGQGMDHQQQQKSKELQLINQSVNMGVDNLRHHYSPVGFNSPRTKSSKPLEESSAASMLRSTEEEIFEVIKIPDSEDDITPLSLVTKKKSNLELDGSRAMAPPVKVVEQNRVVSYQGSSESETPMVMVVDQNQASVSSSLESSVMPSTLVQHVEERPPSKSDFARYEALDQLPLMDQDSLEHRNLSENDNLANSSRHSFALPPRKRLLRQPEDMSETVLSSAATHPAVSISTTATPAASVPAAVTAPTVTATVSLSIPTSSDSPQSSSNFRSCWKKFSAKVNNHGQPVHRSYHAAGKPVYDCRAFFQKMPGRDSCKAGILVGKPYLSGNRFYHRARYNQGQRKEPQQQQEGSSSPRVTRSQARQKKVNGEDPTAASAAEQLEPPPIRKSLRKKTSNSRYDAPDIVTTGPRARKPRNSKKGATELSQDETPKISGDHHQTDSSSGAEKTAEDASADFSSKARKDETQTIDQVGSNRDQIGMSYDQIPEKNSVEELQQPSNDDSTASKAQLSSESKKLDGCDRKSTSSGLSTCSGDVSFDSETPVSLPPKFRHTKRKSNYLGHGAEECQTDTATGSLLSESISAAITTSSSTSTAMVSPVVIIAATVNEGAAIPSTTSAAESQGQGSLKFEKGEEIGKESNSASASETVVSNTQLVCKQDPALSKDLPIKSKTPPTDEPGKTTSQNSVEKSTPSYSAINTLTLPGPADVEAKNQHYPNKITLKFDSNTISAKICNPLAPAPASVAIVDNAKQKTDGSSRKSAAVNSLETVSEFRLKIDLHELNKKSNEQLKRPVVVLMQETTAFTDTATAKTKDHLSESSKPEPVSSVSNFQVATTYPSDMITCSRKVEIPGSSKPKTISVLLRTRNETESGSSLVPSSIQKNLPNNIDAVPSASAMHDSMVSQLADISPSKAPLSKSEKKKRKGKGTRLKRQKKKQQQVPGEEEQLVESLSSQTPDLFHQNSADSLPPPQLEMHLRSSDFAESEVSNRQAVAACSNNSNSNQSLDGSTSVAQDANTSTSSVKQPDPGSGKSGFFASRKRKRSSVGETTATTCVASNAIGAATVSVSLSEFSQQPFELKSKPKGGEAVSYVQTVTSVAGGSVISEFNSGSSQTNSGKSVDIYDWNPNNENDGIELDDIMKMRHSRLAGRQLTGGQLQSSSLTTPLKKRFLTSSESQLQNFDNLLSSCKTVSVVVQKLDSERSSGGPEFFENNMTSVPTALRENVCENYSNDNGLKKRKRKNKKGKQDSKRIKKAIPSSFETPPVLPLESKPLARQPLHVVTASQVASGRLAARISTSGTMDAGVFSRHLRQHVALFKPRETRIPSTIKIPQPVISNPLQMQQRYVSSSLSPLDPSSVSDGNLLLGQTLKMSETVEVVDQQNSSIPVKFKLKKVGRQWTSVNDKREGDEDQLTTGGSSKANPESKKKAQKGRKTQKLTSIFVPESIAQGFICNDEGLKQAFPERVLISEFFKAGFPLPEQTDLTTSGNVEPNVSFKFVFEEEIGEKINDCDVMVDPKNVFFVPSEIELGMAGLSLTEKEKLPEGQSKQRPEVTPVTSASDLPVAVVSADSKKADKKGNTVTVISDTWSDIRPVENYREKDELLSSSLLDEKEDNGFDFKQFELEANRTRKSSLVVIPPFLPLYDDMLEGCPLVDDTSDDLWDVFSQHIINVI